MSFDQQSLIAGFLTLKSVAKDLSSFKQVDMNGNRIYLTQEILLLFYFYFTFILEVSRETENLYSKNYHK